VEDTLTRRQRRPIGQVLLSAGLITEGQLAQALAESSRRGARVGQVLVEKGLIREEDLAAALSDQLDIEQVSLKGIPVDRRLASLLPEGLARRYQLVPAGLAEDELTVAMSDPLNVFASDALRRVIPHAVRKVIGTPSEIAARIDALYGSGSPLAEAMEEVVPLPLGGAMMEESPDRLARMAEETPVVRLVNLLIRQAAVQRASDIHLEPHGAGVRVRYRVDGVLEEAAAVPAHLRLPLISRVKIISGMDIAEKRLPQDGRIRWKEEGREVDIRVSTLPTVHGEKVVLRLLDRSAGMIDLPSLGFSEDVLGALRLLIHRPNGLFLVTGPTGSGKTTTLYAALSEINQVGRNIVTVEDPVEYEVEGLSQVQVAPVAGLEFSTILRNILRQDPDTLMVGEIRDAETAKLSINAALTGHLVFSTLHTNDAVGAVPRLLEMGVEPYLIRSSLAGVLAQRLVRKVCPTCREVVPPPDAVRGRLGGSVSATFFEGKGCDKCRQTGYHGRTAIYEFYRMDQGLRDLVGSEVSHEALLAHLRGQGFFTLREEGIRKAAAGVTTLEEVFRVTQDVEG
jgi:type IV pilus assembly protein PilB